MYYPAMAPDVVLATVKSNPATPRKWLSRHTTHRAFGRSDGGRYKNIVIVVEESLGARFVGRLGGQPLTPELDRLADDGIWFSNLYATGIRSARGLEAIVSGFPPSPARSVLKLGLAQGDFYTIAHSLKPLGYTSYFMYGGESHFDNMRGFLMNNGFDQTSDVNDFDTYRFKGTWGVSDEDLFDRAHRTLSEVDGPFLALIFSSSFHSPFEFPDGRIELHEEPKQTEHNAVKYADFALGGFVRALKAGDYWDDTIVLIVADHDERPHGMSLVPIDSYHIPGLILGKHIEPQEFSKIASQIDLLPTLLTLANVSGNAPFIGDDLLALPEGARGRAVMQFGNNHALMVGNDVVIHRPSRPPAQYLYANGKLTEAPLDRDLAERALALAHLPGVMYGERMYTPLPPQP